MGRWTPRALPPTTPHRHGLTELHEDLDDVDEEPPAAFYRRQTAAAAAQLEHVTDPAIRARLERDLRAWRSALAGATIEEHWVAGEGDRPLF